jgi:RHS repeat-associated protein
VEAAHYRPERWEGFREDYRFTGKEEDVEVGLQYFGKRFYAPLLGRWVSADPLTIHSLGSDLNAYAYVNGQALRGVDPLGLECGVDESCKSAPESNATNMNADTGDSSKGASNATPPRAEAKPAFTHKPPSNAVDAAFSSAWNVGVQTIASTVVVMGASGAKPSGEGGYNFHVPAEAYDWAKEFAEYWTIPEPEASASDATQFASNFTGRATEAVSLYGGRFRGTLLAEGESATRSIGASTGRTFSSPDPFVADLANKIEAAYPGHVTDVNVPLYDSTGKLVTDADILLKNSVIQVKSGTGRGLTAQLRNTESATDLPVIGYGPTLRGSIVRGIEAKGGLVTRDEALLIDVVKP